MRLLVSTLFLGKAILTLQASYSVGRLPTPLGNLSHYLLRV